MYRADLMRAEKGKRRWTNEQLAEKSGLSRPTVAAILDNNEGVKLDSLIRVAEVLEIDLKDLFTFETEEVSA